MSTTPDSIHIRRAVLGDATQLAVSRYRFRSEFGQPSEPQTAFIERATYWFTEHLALPHWRAWVAHNPSQQLVGNLFLQLIEKIPNPVVEAEQIAYITNVFVEPAYRNLGLGARLLHAALDSCRPEEVDSVILWAYPASVSLYQRAGFQVPEILMERPLRQKTQH